LKPVGYPGGEDSY
jgi:hypothetical protein